MYWNFFRIEKILEFESENFYQYLWILFQSIFVTCIFHLYLIINVHQLCCVTGME